MDQPQDASSSQAPSSGSSTPSEIIVSKLQTPLGDENDDNASGVSSTPPTSVSMRSAGSERSQTDDSVLLRRHSERQIKSMTDHSQLNDVQSLQSDSRDAGERLIPEETMIDDEIKLAQATPGRLTSAGKASKGLNPAVQLTRDKNPRRSSRVLPAKPEVKEKAKLSSPRVAKILGKRGRDIVEAGVRTRGGPSKSIANPKHDKLLKQLDMGRGGVLDEMDLDQDFAPPPPPTKRHRKDVSATTQMASSSILGTSAGKAVKRTKKWLKEGLYVGQIYSGSSFSRKPKKHTAFAADNTVQTEPVPPKRSLITLPLYSYLDQARDFVIPFDVFAPALRKGDPKPKDWHQLNKNRLVGDAKELWKKPPRYSESSYCRCKQKTTGQPACDADCHNRLMDYECNTDNCRLSADECGNRPFAELSSRIKKGGAFNIGVEVVKTPNRGFGVRSCRAFAPGQIIMEYTGEVITEEECQKRMREVYKDKECYYLMELERGLIIDGTRGSMARFINHSCAPNCEVRMLTVNGLVRMAVFAGDQGVTTGEELTYDYNFDNFGETRQKCYCGADSCRGYLGPRLNAAEKKRMEKKLELDLQHEAERARIAAEHERQKRETKQDRGSSWKGWVAVDDPDTKARLKAEKSERENRERNSARALRIAGRTERIATTAMTTKTTIKSPVPSQTKKRINRPPVVQVPEFSDTSDLHSSDDTILCLPPKGLNHAKRATLDSHEAVSPGQAKVKSAVRSVHAASRRGSSVGSRSHGTSLKQSTLSFTRLA